LLLHSIYKNWRLDLAQSITKKQVLDMLGTNPSKSNIEYYPHPHTNADKVSVKKQIDMAVKGGKSIVVIVM